MYYIFMKSTVLLIMILYLLCVWAHQHIGKIQVTEISVAVLILLIFQNKCIFFIELFYCSFLVQFFFSIFSFLVKYLRSFKLLGVFYTVDDLYAKGNSFYEFLLKKESNLSLFKQRYYNQKLKMVALNRRLIDGMLLKITSILLQFEQKRNNLIPHCFLHTTFTLQPTIMDLKLIRICFKTSSNNVYPFPTVYTRL